MSDTARTVSILGATGSIGRNALDVIAGQPGGFVVEALTARHNVVDLANLARQYGAARAVIAEPEGYRELKSMLSGTGIEAAAGPAAVAEAAARPVDLVLAAIVGAAGLEPTMAAITAGNHIALANKECLVCAGALFMQAARSADRRVLPVDSEHNAIFQVLERHNRDRLDRIILTASGGPFRLWPRDRLAEARPEEALRHPNWSMGRKVTIDSATLFNKGLELIEAYHLFGLESDRVEVLVHPQSVVHGIVAYRDGAMLAQLGVPDMRVPISYCLAWPSRGDLTDCRLDLAELGSLTFERPDLDRFPALRIARSALDTGAWATNILNAANEIAVEAFLGGLIGFLEIAGMVEETVEAAARMGLNVDPTSIEEALALDLAGRRIAEERIGRRLPV